MKRLSREAREAAIQKIRTTKHAMGSFPTEYQYLTQLTSSLGKDVKFRGAAEARSTALDYARRRNLVVGPEEDIDNDQVTDVVLYDYAGNPVIINGYELMPSERPYRITYRDRFTTKGDKAAIGGYTGFKKNMHSIQGIPEWLSTVPAKFARIKPPKAPRKIAPSLYDHYSDLVRKGLIERINQRLDGRTHLKSTFSIFNVISLTYLEFVLGFLWNHDDNKSAVELIKVKVPNTGDLLCSTHRLELFKSYIKKNQDKITEQLQPVMRTIIERTIDIRDGTPLSIILEPVLSMVSGMPPDLDLAAMKIGKEHETLQHVAVQKAKLSDVMKNHFAYLKSLLINRIFGELDEGDVPNNNVAPTYEARVRRYLDTLLTLDPTTRSQHINALMRDRKHTNDLMNYMNTIKDAKYSQLFHEIDAKFRLHGWLE